MSGTSQTIRPPKQARSRESYEKVLDAAYRLLEENGVEGFTVLEVAARAGVSIGAIYERFVNKETLLRTVHGRLMDEIVEFELAGLTTDQARGPEAVISEWIDRIAASMALHRPVLRAFMHLGALDEEISGRGSLESTAQARRFKAALRPYADQFVHLDPELALDVAFRMTYSTLARQVMYGPLFESDVEVAWGQLSAELARACSAYLLR